MQVPIPTSAPFAARRMPLARWIEIGLRLCLFGVALWLTARIGWAALRAGVGQDLLPTPLAVLEHRLPLVFRLHMLSGGLAVILLPWVLISRRWRRLHRWLGRVVAGLLLLATAAAVPSALASVASPVARLGFLVQGLLCLGLLVGAVHAARQGRLARHRRLMAGVAALVGGVVLLRLMLMVVVMWRLPFASAYAAIAWLSWALPLAGVWALARRADQLIAARQTAGPVRIKEASNA